MNFTPTVVNQSELDNLKKDWITNIDRNHPINIFAYGSLMWKPSCNITKQTKGILSGFHRDFCLYSYIYRGSLENVGLVLGLRSGGKCDGVVMELCPNNLDNDLSCLWDREMITGAYKPIFTDVETEDGIKKCWVFIANENHNQWAGDLSVNQQAELISKAVGDFGSDIDYLINTVKQLRNMNIVDEKLEQLLQQTKK